jgi:hypothetical protein
MRHGWDARRHFRKAAAALIAFTLISVTAITLSAFAAVPVSPPAVVGGGGMDSIFHAQDVSLPTAEALKRSQASNLFAPFTWDGQMVLGPFVQFYYDPRTGEIVRYCTVNQTDTKLVVQTVQIQGFSATSAPLVAGSTFVAAGNGVLVSAHDEPMGLLEIKSLGQPQTVVLDFGTSASNFEISRADSWPRASLAFSFDGGRGEVILGAGNLSVDGMTVTVSMTSDDYLALKALPASADHYAERSAVLDAFASGRLAAEYNLVAVINGGWLENSAVYLTGLEASSTGVQFDRATVNLGMPQHKGGLVLLAFDSQTMPADAAHRLIVTVAGKEIPETANPLAPLYALPGPSGQPSFVRLPMNATVLVVYLPDLNASPLEVESIAHPTAGIDPATEAAMVAAVFVVSVAAAVMFRRQGP